MVLQKICHKYRTLISKVFKVIFFSYYAIRRSFIFRKFAKLIFLKIIDDYKRYIDYRSGTYRAFRSF